MNPNRGAWLEYETDASDVFYVRIDKNRKLPVTVLCRALCLSTNEDILNFFGDDERILATLEKDTTKKMCIRDRTHTLEVSQIARTIARALRLNEDLTEAISLAHDLGHTPFGHAGRCV